MIHCSNRQGKGTNIAINCLDLKPTINLLLPHSISCEVVFFVRLSRAVDTELFYCILSLQHKLWEEHTIKKTFGIVLLLLLGGCAFLVTIVLLLQVVLSLIAAE